MYLEHVIQEAAVRSEIVNNEQQVLQEFKESFNVNEMFKEVYENVGSFIVSDDMLKTYNNIKDYSKNKTLAYLTIKAKELAA